MLYISTSVWVLHTAHAGRNMLGSWSLAQTNIRKKEKKSKKIEAKLSMKLCFEFVPKCCNTE